MRTSLTPKSNEETKQLFRELVELRRKLEHRLDNYDPQKRVITLVIDNLLEKILEESID